LDAKNNLSKIELEIKSLNEDLLKLTKEEEKLNGEKNILKERSKYDASNNKIHENISYLNEEKLKLENSIYLTKKDLDDFYKELEQAKSLLNKDMLSLENIKNEYSRLYSELNNKNIELTDIKHKISITTDYINNGGGFNNSVKSVLNNPRLRGIHQTLGNLIDTEEKYVKAVDIALSASKQFIVVENEESAKQAINYLKENRLGRATFFPLNIIKPRGIDLDTMNILRGDSGFISVLSDKVEYDKIYYNIVSNQLGNIILVDNIDSANKISKRINQRYKIVTLDGDVVHVGGSMSGGSIASNKSIFKEKHELDLLNAKQLELEEIITSINTNLKELQLKRANVEQQTTNNQVRVFKLEEQYNVKNNLSNTLNQNLEEVLKELKSLENVTNSSLSKEEERIVKMFYETSRKKEEVIRNIKNYEKQKDNLNNVIDNIEASNKLNNSTLYSYEKELKTLEINISKMDIKLDNYLKILSEEYEMTYEKAKDNYELEMDLEEAKEEVTIYKNKIKNIGMVNIGAIEDYRRVSERYEFLTSQKNDLLNAKDTLLEIIEEMDTVMKEEFLSTFNAIKEEFEKVFKQLFKGGNATLKLTDPKDILETGVDIIASPPGKKLTSINLLSGGEKTLTAICLIFAILNIKTIPFCLFDEVEAALDEANVDNFGKYLDNYKDKTQFLIITHKKKTMEYANTLYGITMQESGVSKLVSVKLENIKN